MGALPRTCRSVLHLRQMLSVQWPSRIDHAKVYGGGVVVTRRLLGEIEAELLVGNLESGVRLGEENVFPRYLSPICHMMEMMMIAFSLGENEPRGFISGGGNSLGGFHAKTLKGLETSHGGSVEFKVKLIEHGEGVIHAADGNLQVADTGEAVSERAESFLEEGSHMA